MRNTPAIFAVYILILGVVTFKTGWVRSDVLLMLVGAGSAPVAYRIAKSKKL
jgi:hypothetical protein